MLQNALSRTGAHDTMCHCRWHLAVWEGGVNADWLLLLLNSEICLPLPPGPGVKGVCNHQVSSLTGPVRPMSQSHWANKQTRARIVKLCVHSQRPGAQCTAQDPDLLASLKRPTRRKKLQGQIPHPMRTQQTPSFTRNGADLRTWRTVHVANRPWKEAGEP